MAVQDQRAAWRAAVGRAGPVRAHHIPGVLVRHRHGGEAGQVADLVDLDLPAVDTQATVGVRARHEVLGGGTWGGGWMGYGGPWIPILLVTAVAGMVGWIIGR